ncbi:MAG TPA: DUF3619 family protein [Terriglobales bacterium]|nr:DUF3619 family protein [Terriglobales bacterium]
MNERDFAERIARRLDEGLDSLPAGVLYRLRLARDAALSRVHLGHLEPRPTGSARLLNRRVLVPLFALILGLSILVLWQQQPAPQPDYAEIDAQVLSDELPVTAYLDTGFEVWLYHHTAD